VEVDGLKANPMPNVAATICYYYDTIIDLFRIGNWSLQTPVAMVAAGQLEPKLAANVFIQQQPRQVFSRFLVPLLNDMVTAVSSTAHFARRSWLMG
jgi:hypothetical protein